MASSNFIISARQPFLDANGLVTPPWFRFLEALASLVPGQFSTQDLALLAETRQTNAGVAHLTDLDAIALGAAARQVDAGVQRGIDDAKLLAWIAK